jgi:hypothetical protein
VALAQTGQHPEAATSLVQALRLDDGQAASFAAWGNPSLRPYLAVPRIFRLVGRTPVCTVPEGTFLPLMPASIIDVP